MRTHIVIKLLAGLMFCQQVVGNSETHIVEISQFEFIPARLTVAVGDTVVWINRDIVPHTATSQDNTWGSEALAENNTWQSIITADKVGQYYCLFHPNMIGVIELKTHTTAINNVSK